MAIVTRYFSTSSAGAADGTTWADRAALFSAGNWSTVITGFNFSGSDALECRIEGALTYTCSQAMATGLFANAPSAANILTLHGCDSSGNALDPPDPDWVSCQEPFSTSTLPVIATTTNIATCSVANAFVRLVAFTASGRAGAILNAASNFDWVSITSTYNNTSVQGWSGPVRVTNSQLLISGNAFDLGVSGTSALLINVRINGTSATSSGTRIGVYTGSAGYTAIGVTVIGCAGGGMLAAAGSATRYSSYHRCSLINNGTYGILCNSTASQTVWHPITNCYFANNGTYGIDANGSRCEADGNRLRDNTSGNFANFGNYSTARNYTTDSDDATEFVNSGTGDYRIKNTATIWGKGYGPGDEPASGSGGTKAYVFGA